MSASTQEVEARGFQVADQLGLVSKNQKQKHTNKVTPMGNCAGR
jgi:hypothetical protein